MSLRLYLSPRFQSCGSVCLREFSCVRFYVLAPPPSSLLLPPSSQGHHCYEVDVRHCHIFNTGISVCLASCLTSLCVFSVASVVLQDTPFFYNVYSLCSKVTDLRFIAIVSRRSSPFTSLVTQRQQFICCPAGIQLGCFCLPALSFFYLLH